MNRRSFFSILAAAPIATVAAAKDNLSPPPVAVLVEGPDFYLLSFTPTEITHWSADQYRYAMITDEPYFTRAAVYAGWHRVIPQIPRYTVDTGLPSAMFARNKGRPA